MTQQPPAKTPEQTLEKESSAKKRPFTKPTLKKLEKPKLDDLSEEFRELLGH